MKLRQEHKALMELVRIGVTGKCAFSEVLAQADWQMLFRLSSMHGVACLCMEAVVVMHSCNVSLCPKKQKLQWYAKQQQIMKSSAQKQNDCIGFAACVHPIRLVVLKGMDYARFWPNVFWRDYGDLDCRVVGSASELLEKRALAAGCMVVEAGYKHSHIHYKNLLIENHHCFSSFGGTAEGKRIEMELEHLFFSENSRMEPLCQGGLLSPPADFTALFMLTHMQRHFFGEGITLKQILDWLFFLQKDGKEVDWTMIHSVLQRTRLVAFADMVTLVCCKYLGLAETPYHLSMVFSDVEIEDFVSDVFEYSYNPNDRSLRNRVGGLFVRFQRMFRFRRLLFMSWDKAVRDVLAFTKWFRIKH